MIEHIIYVYIMYLSLLIWCDIMYFDYIIYGIMYSYTIFHTTSIYPTSNILWGGGIGQSQCCTLARKASPNQIWLGCGWMRWEPGIPWNPPEWFRNCESEKCWLGRFGMFQGYVGKFLETSWRCWKILRLEVASWSQTLVAIGREILTNMITKRICLNSLQIECQGWWWLMVHVFFFWLDS